MRLTAHVARVHGGSERSQRALVPTRRHCDRRGDKKRENKVAPADCRLRVDLPLLLFYLRSPSFSPSSPITPMPLESAMKSGSLQHYSRA